MKKITKSALFYVQLFALLTFLMVFSWEVLDYVMHTVPAQQFNDSPLTVIGKVTQALGNGLKDWVGVLLLYWGWLIYQDWKIHSYIKTLLWAAGSAAVSLAVSYGVTLLFAVPTLQILIERLFIAMTGGVLLLMAIILGIAQLWKTQRAK